MGIPGHITCLLRNLYAGQEVIELDMEKQTGSKLEKEYVKGVSCYLAYLTSVLSTLSEMPDWMRHKMESRLPGEISINSEYADYITLMAESEEELNSLFIRVKEEGE